MDDTLQPEDDVLAVAVFEEEEAPPFELSAALAELDQYWAGDYGRNRRVSRIAGSDRDQLVPAGVNNPYWELIRQMPCETFGWGSDADPCVYTHGLTLTREPVVRTYAWAIPSPGDIAWITTLLEGRDVVEVGAGSGYWAWQLAQAGVDVIAYDPATPEDNNFVLGNTSYHPLVTGDALAASNHKDRALFMSWPNYSSSWAAHALAAYRGDLLIYVGESYGGCCADDDFFNLLHREWTEIDFSAHHRTWSGIHCHLSAYRRNTAAPHPMEEVTP